MAVGADNSAGEPFTESRLAAWIAWLGISQRLWWQPVARIYLSPARAAV